jgi:lysozyme family protein
VSFDRAFDHVIGQEGGYSNDPRDPGGETQWGISKRQYPNVDIARLSAEDAREIYRRDYWYPIRGDDLPVPVAICLFDYAVNSGVEPAARALQRILGVTVDGVIGKQTIEAARRRPVREVVKNLQAERLMLLASLSTFATFGRGWTRRVIDTALEALA